MKTLFLIMAIVGGLSALITPIVIWFNPSLIYSHELSMTISMYGGGLIAFISTLMLSLKNQHG